MQTYSKTLSERKLNPCLSRDAELVTIPAVRAILRRVKISPVLAFTLAALSGLNVEAR